MDIYAISNGLANRYIPAVVTPPSGYKNITDATGQPRNNIPNTPFVIVWPTEGEINLGAVMGEAKGDSTFLVTFYYSKAEGDLPREYKALEKWVGILLAQLNGAIKLGIVSGVDKALPVHWEIGTQVYAGVTYEVITITVHVWTTDVVSLVL